MEEAQQVTNPMVLKALESVLASHEFARSQRLSSFLRHLVECSLAGKQDQLKGYALGIDVFGRDERFNPETDTIVRVHAVRLRKALATYYTHDGVNDPLIISIPKGRYVPAFVLAQDLEQVATSNPGFQKSYPTDAQQTSALNWQPFEQRAAVALMLLSLMACAIALIAFIGRTNLQEANNTSRQKNMIDNASKIPSGPSVMVLNFENLSDKKHSPFIRGIAIQITSRLSRFRNMFVYAPDTAFQIKSPQMAWNKYHVRYALTGAFQHSNNNYQLDVHLIELPGRELVWSQEFRGSVTTEKMLDDQSEISNAVAAAIGQPYGAISRIESRGNSKASITAYGCYLRFFDYARHENEKLHLEVRTCLERAVKETPDFALGWAALSWMLVDEHRQKFNQRPHLKPAMGRALKAARKSIRLDPSSAFSHRRLADVYMVLGWAELAKNCIMQALKLNPNNAEVLADVGWILKNTGQWEEAMSYATKAIALNPAFPPWYLETPFFYHYKKGDCKKAKEVATQYYQMNASTLLPHIIKIAVEAECGDTKQAASSIKQIKTLHSDFLKSPHKGLTQQCVPYPLIKKILTNLQSAGLKLPKS